MGGAVRMSVQPLGRGSPSSGVRGRMWGLGGVSRTGKVAVRMVVYVM